MRIELSEDDLSEAIGLLLYKRGIRGHADIEMRCRVTQFGKVREWGATVTMTESKTAEKEERR